jgi:hypothetical protein
LDVVYLCRDGDNEELRYSLRSLKNIQHDDVWIFGGKPDWVTNVNFVPVQQSPVTRYSKNKNTTMLLEFALYKVPDDFIMMNDDFFITENIGTVPLYNRGPIKDVYDYYTTKYPKQSVYMEDMLNTHNHLIDMGIETPLSFELHVPMPVNKEGMRYALEVAKTMKTNAPQKRSLYGNLAGFESERMEDLKITSANFNSEDIPDTPFLSTSDKSFERIRPMFRYFFRKPSIYETGV